MQMGANGEEWELLPAIQPPAGTTSTAVFNYRDLSELVQFQVTDVKVRDELLRLLRQAEAAEVRGDLSQKVRLLDSFVSVLQKVRLPAVQIGAMTQIARSL